VSKVDVDGNHLPADHTNTVRLPAILSAAEWPHRNSRLRQIPAQGARSFAASSHGKGGRNMVCGTSNGNTEDLAGAALATRTANGMQW